MAGEYTKQLLSSCLSRWTLYWSYLLLSSAMNLKLTIQQVYCICTADIVIFDVLMTISWSKSNRIWRKNLCPSYIYTSLYFLSASIISHCIIILLSGNGYLLVKRLSLSKSCKCLFFNPAIPCLRIRLSMHFASFIIWFIVRLFVSPQRSEETGNKIHVHQWGAGWINYDTAKAEKRIGNFILL